MKPLTNDELRGLVAIDSWPSEPVPVDFNSGALTVDGDAGGNRPACQEAKVKVQEGLIGVAHNTNPGSNEDSLFLLWSTVDQARASADRIEACLNADPNNSLVVDPVADSPWDGGGGEDVVGSHGGRGTVG